MKCGTCVHGIFPLTPTGRIKKKEHGQCHKQLALLQMFSHKRAAPCVVLSVPHGVAIWSNYDASQCPLYASKENKR